VYLGLMFEGKDSAKDFYNFH